MTYGLKACSCHPLKLYGSVHGQARHMYSINYWIRIGGNKLETKYDLVRPV